MAGFPRGPGFSKPGFQSLVEACAFEIKTRHQKITIDERYQQHNRAVRALSA